jgi:hypothetical protein
VDFTAVLRYSLGMPRPRKPPRAKRSEDVPWDITHITGTPAKYLGRVLAKDEKSAIDKAIEEFGITNPQIQKRLMARRAD